MQPPGKAHRDGISIMQLTAMFPTEEAAETWFEEVRWGATSRHCAKCGSTNTYEVKRRKPQPYRCRSCKSYFSVRTGSALAETNLPLRTWLHAIYLYITSLKSVSSMKLHRDLGITQKTAWFLLHRLRTAWDGDPADLFTGPVEVDETYMGGKARNKSNHQRRQAKATGNEVAPKTAVVGAKDRCIRKVAARVVAAPNMAELLGLVTKTVGADAVVYTDEAKAYQGLPRSHGTVKHGAGEYVRGDVHTNGVESFWSMLKRAHMGTFHHLSPKHLHRYVAEFAGRHNVRNQDTIKQMQAVVAGTLGKRLMYAELVAKRLKL